MDEWFQDPDFGGCMFINASAEFSVADSPPRRLAAEHKQEENRRRETHAVLSIAAKLSIRPRLSINTPPCIRAPFRIKPQR